MKDILKLIKDRDPGEKEFHQAVEEVIESVLPVLDRNPQYRKEAVLERIVEPERVIILGGPGHQGGLQGRRQGDRDPADRTACRIFRRQTARSGQAPAGRRGPPPRPRALAEVDGRIRGRDIPVPVSQAFGTDSAPECLPHGVGGSVSPGNADTGTNVTAPYVTWPPLPARSRRASRLSWRRSRRRSDRRA